MAENVYLADLTHTATGISALTFPLGTGFVASYAEEVHGSDFNFKLFKFPEELAKAIEKCPPKVLALSNFSWNLEIGYAVARWVRELHPETIIVFGGPNFPVDESEQENFLRKLVTSL